MGTHRRAGLNFGTTQAPMTSPKITPSTSSSSSTPSNPRNLAGRPRADTLIVYAGRGLRDMGRGLIAVILAIYLAEIGLSIPQIGLVLGASLVGGFVLSLIVMFTANRVSRRAWFTVIAAVTGLAVGMLFATENVWLIGFASFFGSYAGSGMH